MTYNSNTAKILYQGELQKQKDYILEHFNFNEVAQCMKLVDWKWLSDKTSPTAAQIKELAERLLDEVIENPEKEYYVFTGGLRAIKDLNALTDQPILTLEFVLEHEMAFRHEAEE